ncbi:MAG: chromosome segregation protein SMC [Candidatus Abyssubacteria bacterium]
MYFKQLELFGFKSFAEKTCLHLEKGISAIVGPNGCGKSNIGDAIRWVFGEQRMRVLRGQHMEDVIFAGSEERHPLGMAEVTLVLDNSDGSLPLEYNEVSVTRRLFRSGESEYYINKMPCRRKDIVELLMGTGIGADSYSLIEQGRIDLLLSSKPEERRYIFEDAAGIIKYKSRKDAALRKLERADANLLRLQDTIIEVRRRINSLKRQASAAQRYRQLRDELRSTELRLALFKYQRLDDEYRQMTDRARELRDHLEQTAARETAYETEVEQARLAMLELQNTLSRSSEHSHDLQSQIEKSESQIALLREKIAAIDSREKRDLAEIEELKALREGLTHEYAQTLEQERHALARASEAQQELQAKTALLDRLTEQLTHCETEIETLRSVSLDKLNRKVNLKNELGTVDTNLDMLAKRKTRLLERKAQLQESIQQYENRLSETRNMTKSLRAALASLSSEINTVADTITAKESELEQSVTERDSIRDSLSAARSKLASLEELRDKFEGYDEGVRAIMRARQQGEQMAEGVLGTVAEIIHAEREQETAIEAALGHALQHIVVKDVESAHRCAELLESSRAGRASFIPLSSISPNGTPQELPDSDGCVLGNAIDKITCDVDMLPLAQKLLGSTVIVDSLDNALAIAFFNRSDNGSPHLDLVTMRGEAVSSSGVISAGSAGQGRGLIGRKNEIEELRRFITEMESKSETESARIASLKRDIEHARELLQKLRDAIGSHEVELAKAERDLQQLTEAKKRDEEELDVLLNEHALAVTESDELRKQRESLAQQIEHAAKIETETNDRLRDSGQRLTELRKQKDELAAQITDFKVSVSSLELTCKTFRHELGRLESETRETNRRIAEKQKQLEEGAQARAAHSSEIDVCRAAIQTLFEQKNALDSEIAKLEEQKRLLSENIDTMETNLKDTRAQRQQMGEQSHQVEVALAQTEEKISFLKQKTIDEYRLSMSEIAQEFTIDDSFDAHAAEDEVARLKSRIESLGAVNLIAIEEFEQLQNRYDFLIQQETDLRKAKEALLGIIRKINETTQAMFLSTFNLVRAHFHEIFRHLFGGGRANVYLSDPVNPLESGIEISVQPPGKKLQNISALSGGEKALTAISLLFAIFKTKPSPFCVLDEVDAALDDSNILRFTRLVKMFSENVQFIIVTHNKRTMELADLLYGVTMEERGVSQLVSVKFKKAPAFEFLETTPT